MTFYNSDRSGDTLPIATPEDWPYPKNAFVRASRLVEDNASDQQVRAAVKAIEDGGSP